MNNQVPNGLKELPKDDRDFKIGAIVDLPPLSELPDTFVIGLPVVKNQKDSDFCAAFASCALSELQEEVELCPEWVFAKAKELDGDVEGFGTDLRTICKVHCKWGAPEVIDCPYSLKTGQSVDFLRRIENYPKELETKAGTHKKGSYFSVEAVDSDAFDTIRRTIWKFRNEKCGVVFGVLWSWALSQVDMFEPGQGGGHALAQIGWTTFSPSEEGGALPFMYIQNSYGPEAGLQGRHYFSREVINAFALKFGVFLFHDMPSETAKHYMDNGIKLSDNWFVKFLKPVWNLIALLWRRK